MLAALVTTGKHLWTFAFIGRLKTTTAEELRERWTRGRPDRWEHSEHKFIDFDPGSAIRHIVETALQGGWTNWAPAVYYLALVNEFGRDRVERAVRRTTRGIERSAWYKKASS
jgi:hypothetical protein